MSQKKEIFCNSVLQKQSSAHTFSCYNVDDDDDGEVNESERKRENGECG